MVCCCFSLLFSLLLYVKSSSPRLRASLSKSSLAFPAGLIPISTLSRARLQLKQLRQHGARQHVPDPHGAGPLRVQEEEQAARGHAAVLGLEGVRHACSADTMRIAGRIAGADMGGFDAWGPERSASPTVARKGANATRGAALSQQKPLIACEDAQNIREAARGKGRLTRPAAPRGSGAALRCTPPLPPSSSTCVSADRNTLIRQGVHLGSNPMRYAGTSEWGAPVAGAVVVGEVHPHLLQQVSPQHKVEEGLDADAALLVLRSGAAKVVSCAEKRANCHRVICQKRLLTERPRAFWKRQKVDGAKTREHLSSPNASRDAARTCVQQETSRKGEKGRVDPCGRLKREHRSGGRLQPRRA